MSSGSNQCNSKSSNEKAEKQLHTKAKQGFADLMVELGLADNSLGKMIIDKLVKHSGNNVEKARAIIDSYKETIRTRYPDEHLHLIIIDFMEDEGFHKTNKVNFATPAKRYEVMNSVPCQIAYLVYAPYRPALD